MEAAPFVSANPFRSASRSLLLSNNDNIYRKSLKFKSRKFSVRASANNGDSVVTLLDYGAGTVRSVRNAIQFLGYDIKDVQTPEDILSANRLIFPGMDLLNQTGMAEALFTYIENDRPFLGICLGLQLLFECSEENGPVKGLGLIPGISAGMLFKLQRTQAIWMILEAVMSILFTRTVHCLQILTRTGSHQHAIMEIISLLLSKGEMCMPSSFTQKRVEMLVFSY